MISLSTKNDLPARTLWVSAPPHRMSSSTACVSNEAPLMVFYGGAGLRLLSAMNLYLQPRREQSTRGE